MNIAVFKKAQPTPTIGPAERTLRDHRAELVAAQARYQEEAQLLSAIRSAVSAAEASVNAPHALRRQLAAAEVQLTAAAELEGRTADLSGLADLRSRLAAAEATAQVAVSRLEVERAKQAVVDRRVADARARLQELAAQTDIRIQDAALERLQTELAPFAAAVETFRAVYVRTMAVARACDVLAEAAKRTGKGRTVWGGAQAAVNILIPVPLGSDAKFDREEMMKEINTQAADLLAELSAGPKD